MSVISRLNTCRYLDREFHAMGLHSNIPSQARIELGSRVKVRVPRNIFKRHDPLRKSIWSDDTYLVQSIDFSTFPPIYKLDNDKKYYDFQLLKLGPYYPLDQSSTPEAGNRRPHPPGMLVNSYRIDEESTPRLRSGSRTSSNPAITYNVLSDGNVRDISELELRMYKKTFGEQSIAYSSMFNSKPHSEFLI